MFLLSVLCITLLTAILPYAIRQTATIFLKIKLQKSYDWLPPLAAFLFVAAFFLPNIHISNETSTFQQHFVGGGMYTACLYVYFKKLFDWDLLANTLGTLTGYSMLLLAKVDDKKAHIISK